MQEHGLNQSDLPEVGTQSVVSAVLAGKRSLNLRQVTPWKSSASVSRSKRRRSRKGFSVSLLGLPSGPVSTRWSVARSVRGALRSPSGSRRAPG